MLEVRGNLWDYPSDFTVITTNGAIRKDGALVMGRGCAREAKDKFPGLEYSLGALVEGEGNKVFALLDEELITFPVKHHWRQSADINLIENSVKDLVIVVNQIEKKFNCNIKVVMPRPGCGNGNLYWKDVKPVIEKYLDDRFSVITF